MYKGAANLSSLYFLQSSSSHYHAIMRVWSVFALIASSIGLLGGRAQASLLPAANRDLRSIFTSSNSATLDNSRQKPSTVHSQSPRISPDLQRRDIDWHSMHALMNIPQLYKRGGCVGKHPCERDHSPTQSPQRTRTHSSDVLNSPASHIPGSVSSFETPPQIRPLSSRPGTSSTSPYSTPLARTLVRQQRVKQMPQLGFGASMRNLLDKSSPPGHPSPLIGNPLHSKNIKSRSRLGHGVSTRNLSPAFSSSKDESPLPNADKNMARDSNPSTPRSELTVGEIVPMG